MKTSILTLCLLLVASVTGCATSDYSDPVDDGAFVGHGELSDFDPVDGEKADGVGTVFRADSIMTDEFFSDSDMMDADAVQRFLEDSPYGTHSWLADETVGGVRAADALVAAARDFQVNPLMLLARMQVEAGLISKTQRPTQRRVDRALGCGCYDGQACLSRYSGLDKQLRCGANTLRTRFADSEDGTGEWRLGSGTKTLDGRWVKPVNHATASLYAYTPWVLEGQGGTWLVWNITKKYEKHVLENGFEAGGNTAWIGTACVDTDDCNFQSGGVWASCHKTTAGTGFCSLPCEGYCSDLTGHPDTFCVALPNTDGGTCVSQAKDRNGACELVEDTLPTWASRYVGTSGAAEATKKVCLP